MSTRHLADDRRSEPVRAANCLLQPIIQGRSRLYRLSMYRPLTPEVAGSSPVAPALICSIFRVAVGSAPTPTAHLPHARNRIHRPAGPLWNSSGGRGAHRGARANVLVERKCGLPAREVAYYAQHVRGYTCMRKARFRRVLCRGFLGDLAGGRASAGSRPARARVAPPVRSPAPRLRRQVKGRTATTFNRNRDTHPARTRSLGRYRAGRRRADTRRRTRPRRPKTGQPGGPEVNSACANGERGVTGRCERGRHHGRSRHWSPLDA
jgi:hypothetical protein